MGGRTSNSLGSLGTGAVAAREAIAGLCAGDLPGLDLLERVHTRLRTVVPHMVGGWTVTDPASTLITGVFTVDMPARAHLGVLDHEFLDDDFNTFRDLARRRWPVGTLDQATSGETDRSARMRNFGHPMGMASELRAVFGTGRACWGTACLVRDETEPGFTAAEVAVLDGVRGYVAHGLRSAQLLEAATRGEQPGSPGPGMVVLGDDDSVESLTDTARWWLAQLPADRGPRLELPAVVYHVARAARTAGHYGSDGAARPPARARVRLGDGRWLVVHAARLHGADGTSGRTAVMLELAGPGEVAGLLCELHELTAREREITGMLVRGLGIDEIAGQLFISRHTVRDHTKAIFAKLRVTSRAELTALLFYDHALPTLDHRTTAPVAAGPDRGPRDGPTSAPARPPASGAGGRGE